MPGSYCSGSHGHFALMADVRRPIGSFTAICNNKELGRFEPPFCCIYQGLLCEELKHIPIGSSMDHQLTMIKLGKGEDFEPTIRTSAEVVT